MKWRSLSRTFLAHFIDDSATALTRPAGVFEFETRNSRLETVLETHFGPWTLDSDWLRVLDADHLHQAADAVTVIERGIEILIEVLARDQVLQVRAAAK